MKLLLAFALAAAATPAAAATCTVDPQSVIFGGYDPLSGSPAEGVGNIHVECDSSASVTVALGSGLGSVADRRMTSGADALHYNLYSDPAHTALWGDGMSAPDVAATGKTIDLPVYGRIPALQNLPAGSYADTLVVTVTF